MMRRLVFGQNGKSYRHGRRFCRIRLNGSTGLRSSTACIERKSFRGSEFLYTLRLASGERVLAHVPSHHDHQIGEWIGIRPVVDHVVTFERQAPAPTP